MDRLGSAASVIAVIQLAGSIIQICGGYYIGIVKNAGKDIKSLQRAVESFKDVLEQLSGLFKGPDGGKLLITLKLVLPISDYLNWKH
jgi:hypothetical protein